MKNLKILAVLLAAVLAFAGCNSYKKDNYPVKIGGAEVTHAPSGVVSLAPYISEIIYGMGQEELLVGRSSGCAFNGNVRQLPDMGSVLAPDTDAIIASGATVVFAAAQLPAGAAQKLSDEGVEICLLALPTSVSEMVERVISVCAVLKGNNRAELISKDYLSDLDTKLEYVDYKLVRADKPRVVFVLSADGSVVTGDTLLGEIMELAGLENIAADYKNYTMPFEDILAAQPELVIITDPPSASFLYTDAGFSTLDAVKGGRILEIGYEFAERFTPSVAETLYALAYAVHGDLMAAPDASGTESSIPSAPEMSVPTLQSAASQPVSAESAAD